jgi:hypothetical protein
MNLTLNLWVCCHLGEQVCLPLNWHSALSKEKNLSATCLPEELFGLGFQKLPIGMLVKSRCLSTVMGKLFVHRRDVGLRSTLGIHSRT